MRHILLHTHIYIYTNYSVPGLKINEENLTKHEAYFSLPLNYAILFTEVTFVMIASAMLISFVGTNSKYIN